MKQISSKSKQIVWVAVALIFTSCAGLTPRPYSLKRIPQVQVRIIPDISNISVFSKKPLVLKQGARVIFKWKRKTPISFKVMPSGQIVCESKNKHLLLNGDHWQIQSPSEGTIAVNGKRYRGALKLNRNATGNLTVVNELDLESYVKGVVPKEIGPGNREIFEALKAQAVAARTYAYRSLIAESSKGPNPLEATVSDQVYGGADVESTWTNRAVEATLGEILTNAGKPIYAFYSSTCGGRTEPVSDVWPQIRAPYLRGVADNFGQGDFCRASPHYRWLELWSADELDSLLRAGLTARGAYQAAWGRLKDLRVVSRFPSGRIRDLEIDFQRGKVVLHGNRLRWLLKPNDRSLLRSTLCRFQLYRKRGRLEAVLVVGAGNGHGVGMCQWGAMGMAKAGYTYRQILGHYYRGARLKRVY